MFFIKATLFCAIVASAAAVKTVKSKPYDPFRKSIRFFGPFSGVGFPSSGYGMVSGLMPPHFFGGNAYGLNQNHQNGYHAGYSVVSGPYYGVQRVPNQHSMNSKLQGYGDVSSMGSYTGSTHRFGYPNNLGGYSGSSGKYMGTSGIMSGLGYQGIGYQGLGYPGAGYQGAIGYQAMSGFNQGYHSGQHGGFNGRLQGYGK